MVVLTLFQQESLKSQGFSLLQQGSYLDDGTFSTVLAAENLKTGQKVAIKIVDKLLVMKHDKCQAILEEKRIHLSLSNENVVKLFSTFQDDQSLYFVLELCEGGNLLKFKNNLQNHQIRTISKQLIKAVQYLHSVNILHRDIKPENIFISADAVLKLGDFGSALKIESWDSSILGEELNKFVGTPEYLAPEILRGGVKWDETAFALDWWAVGCTVYWLLTGGKVLFEAATEYLVYKIIESGPSASNLKECCDFDDLVAEIIFGLLEKDPIKRIKFVREQLPALLSNISD